MNLKRTGGFTLIEIVVAVAVFGVMSIIAYQTLGRSLAAANDLTEHTERMQSIQRTMVMLSSDFMQAAPRPIRNELGDGFYPALRANSLSEFALEITHGGWRNPAGLPRGTQQRSAYRLEDDALMRYHWRILDRTFANEAIATTLVDGVEAFTVRFLQANGEWSEVWPAGAQTGGGDQRSRPRAVEILLRLEDEGELRRLVEISP